MFDYKKYMKSYHKYHRRIYKGDRTAQSKRYAFRNKDKIQAYNKVHYAVRRGDILKPERCSICDSAGLIMAHHHDYSKPLDVIWVCWICHNNIHGR